MLTLLKSLLQRHPKIVRWEYLILPLSSSESENFIENQLILNTMGQIGWEMVAVQGQYGIFKRHAQAQ